MANLTQGCRIDATFRQGGAIALALGMSINAAAAQAPQDLKWWTDDSAPATATVPEVTSDAAFGAGRATVHDAQQWSKDSVPTAAPMAPADLQWWETERTAAELNWWKAKRDGESLRWWSADSAAVRQVAAQQSPFGRKPTEAAPETAPETAPKPQPPLDGRTPGAAGVTFDPFLVVPALKPMTDIDVTLIASPPVPIAVTMAEPTFTGTAAEYFASKGSAFLAPRVWPQRTPEAAAYQFYSRPLWYEDANVERCGETAGCLQPVVSGTYFFANTLLLPYRFAAEPQCETVPQKQFCPPGCRYTHAQNYLPPWSPAGAVAEGAAITGLIFLVP